MLDNGIKLGLRNIDTALGIALLCGDHGYVCLYDCAIVVTLWFCQDAMHFRIGEVGKYCASA